MAAAIVAALLAVDEEALDDDRELRRVLQEEAWQRIASVATVPTVALARTTSTSRSGLRPQPAVGRPPTARVDRRRPRARVCMRTWAAASPKGASSCAASLAA